MVQDPATGQQTSDRYNRGRVPTEEPVIRPLKPPDVGPAAALLGRAMSTNPLHVAVFKGRGEIALRRQVQMFSVFLREFPGGRFVARKGNEIVGVMRSVRSPLCRLPPEEAARLGPVMAAILGDAAPRVGRWFTIWARHDPKEVHWHFGPIAVAVEHQGRGIGSAMLRRFCERVDRHGQAAHLETDKPENVRLYERFGFRTREEVDIFGVNNYFMWRAPR
jgi:ribosomal protein S18 acetylase RimI-like enzyme